MEDIDRMGKHAACQKHRIILTGQGYPNLKKDSLHIALEARMRDKLNTTYQSALQPRGLSGNTNTTNLFGRGFG